MNYLTNSTDNVMNTQLTIEIADFKEKLLTYIRTKGCDSSFEDYVDVEADLLVSRISCGLEDIMSNSHKVALQKANYIIKLQNLSLRIASHFEKFQNP